MSRPKGFHHSEETKIKMGKARKGEKHPLWRGGRTLHSGGYIYIYNSEHPNSDTRGYILEHRLIMEMIIMRYLIDNEVVHHINGEKADNRPKNLMLFSNSKEHSIYHMKIRAFTISGNYNWRKCNYCKKHDDPKNLKFEKCAVYHASCRAKYLRERKKR